MCPMCWESFDIGENEPYILWCGHTLCNNCILGFHWPVLNFPPLPIQLPLFISCPWCNLLSFRLVYRGCLKLPRKNFFLLGMVEARNGKSPSLCSGDHHPIWSSNLTPGCQLVHSNTQCVKTSIASPSPNHISSYLRKLLVLFVQLTSKFPLVLILFLIVSFVMPASAAILAMYLLITILFAFPSVLILGIACPSLDWLSREITA